MTEKENKEPAAEKDKEKDKDKGKSQKKGKKPAEDKKRKGSEKTAAGKKPKLEKKIYVIVCATLIFLLAGVVSLILMITTGSKKDKALKKEREDVSAAEPSPEGEGETSDEEEPSGEEEPPKEESDDVPSSGGGEEKDEISEPEPDPEPESRQEPDPEGDLLEEMHVSLSEAVNFVEGLSPSLLNLPGESMSEYEILTNQYIIPVDGLLCSEVMVYNKDDTTGTNELMATLLVDRGPDGRLFRMEHESGDVVEVDLTAGEQAAP